MSRILGIDASGRRRAALALFGAAILGALVSCATHVPLDTPGPMPAPVDDRGPRSAAPAAPAVSGTPTMMSRVRSRWVSVNWSELPGWDNDRVSEFWPSLMRSCERPAQGWDSVCAQARSMSPPDDRGARTWLQQHFQPYRVEALDTNAEGMITGYFEPLVAARRVPTGPFRVPLYGPPLDLASRKPYWTRQQLDTSPVAQASLKGREIAYVADTMDMLVLQIQGSGRLNLTEADGSTRLVRVAFAGHNEQPYKSVGRWLVDQGEMRLDQASWISIKAWAQMNPQRLNELLWANPRYVFFREEPLLNPDQGPRGAQGVPLTPGRSIAVDKESIPYGTPVWLDTTEPLSSTPLRRMVMAQDTGSAITGAVRADYFWGWGDQAEQQASRMKQPLRLWALWPRS